MLGASLSDVIENKRSRFCFAKERTTIFMALLLGGKIKTKSLIFILRKKKVFDKMLKVLKKLLLDSKHKAKNKYGQGQCEENL